MANNLLSMARRNEARLAEMNAIAGRLRRAVNERGAKSTHLDVAIGQSKGQTSRLLHGKRTQNVNASVLHAYARELRVSYKWLAHGEGNMEDLDDSQSPEEADMRRTFESDAIDDAVRYHAHTFSRAVVLAVRERAKEAGVEVDSREPRDWAVELFAELARQALAPLEVAAAAGRAKDLARAAQKPAESGKKQA